MDIEHCIGFITRCPIIYKIFHTRVFIVAEYISRMKSLQTRMEEIYPKLAATSSRSSLVSQLADEKYLIGKVHHCL